MERAVAGIGVMLLAGCAIILLLLAGCDVALMLWAGCDVGWFGEGHGRHRCDAIGWL